ncbi:MAG: magnesium transporter CorA family protein [Candidatus Sungbacteria bacterium]|nr:magnesium transporter CorA family protein [Candidatus Sungbacteria bacterium]
MEVIKHKNISWVDIRNPGDRDLEFLKKEYGVHDDPLRELAIETATPKIDHFDNQLYVVLHFPVFNYDKRTSEGKEVDFIVTKETLVTVRYDEIAPLEELSRTCGISPGVREECFGDTPTHLLFIILSHMYDYLMRELGHIKKNIDEVDSTLFRVKENQLVRKILEIRRDILNFRRTLAPQKQILESMAERGGELLGRRSRESFQDLMEAYNRVWSLLEYHKEAIEAMHETNNSLLSSRQNDTIQTLTILSVTAFYLTLIAAVFAVDAVYKPIVGSRYDFWVILAFMGAAAVILLGFFKWKKWW